MRRQIIAFFLPIFSLCYAIDALSADDLLNKATNRCKVIGFDLNTPAYQACVMEQLKLLHGSLASQADKDTEKEVSKASYSSDKDAAPLLMPDTRNTSATQKDAQAQNFDKEYSNNLVQMPDREALDKKPLTAPARIKKLDNLNKYYPKSMKRSGVPGAAAIVRVCVNEKSVIREPPILVVSSFNQDFDAASLRMANKGKYTAGVIDGVPVPGCVSFRVTGRYNYEATTAQVRAVENLRAALAPRLPSIEGDVEIKSVAGSGADLVWTKSLWKRSESTFSDQELRALFDRYSTEEETFYCSIESFRNAFGTGVTVVTWYTNARGRMLFGIITNGESCTGKKY